VGIDEVTGLKASLEDERLSVRVGKTFKEL